MKWIYHWLAGILDAPGLLKFCVTKKSKAKILFRFIILKKLCLTICFAHQELIFLNKCISVHWVGNTTFVLISFCQNCWDYSTGIRLGQDCFWPVKQSFDLCWAVQGWFWISAMDEAKICFLQYRQVVFKDTGMITGFPPKETQITIIV
jgi:hypothetical protein